MYQLIIYWDTGKSEVACEGTQVEIYNHINQIADTINPDDALWEIKWAPAKSIVNQVSVNNIMGRVERIK